MRIRSPAARGTSSQSTIPKGKPQKNDFMLHPNDPYEIGGEQNDFFHLRFVPSDGEVLWDQPQKNPTKSPITSRNNITLKTI